MLPYYNMYNYPSGNNYRPPLPSLYNYEISPAPQQEKQKIKLPSLSNIRIFTNYQQPQYPYQPPVQYVSYPPPTFQPHQHQQQQHLFQTKLMPPVEIVNNTNIPTRMTTVKPNTTPFGTPTPSTSSSRNSFPSKRVKKETNRLPSESNSISRKKIYDLSSFEFSRKPPKLFPNLEVNTDFIYRNLRRDYKYGRLNKEYNLDFTKSENEITLNRDDLIRWKFTDFCLDYLKMHDARDEKSLDSLKEIERKNLLHIKLQISLQLPLGEDGLMSKSVSLDLKAIKPDSSKLTKLEVVETIESNLEELAINYDIQHPGDDGQPPAKKRRRASSQPKWGLGYQDELSVVFLNVEVSDISG